MRFIFGLVLSIGMLFLGTPPSATAEGLRYTPDGLSGASLALYEFFRKRKAYFLRFHQQERPGDIYVMPEMYPVAPLERCYRNIKVITPLNQTRPQPYVFSNEFGLDASLEASWVAAELGVDIFVSVRPSTHLQFEKLSFKSTTDLVTQPENWREDNCGWLRSLYVDGRFDGTHLPIVGIWSAEGKAINTIELNVDVDGHLNADRLTKAVSRIREGLDEVGLGSFVPDVKLRAALKTGYSSVSYTALVMDEPTPVAFLPKVINRDAMDRYIDAVGYEGEYLGKFASASLRNPDTAAQFLNDFPNFRFDLSNTSFVPPLLRAGNVVVFEQDNPTHSAAVEAELFFIQLNDLAALSNSK